MIAFSTPALPTQTWRPGWTLADYQEVTETFLCLSSFHVTPEPSANTWAEHWTNATANSIRRAEVFLFLSGRCLHRDFAAQSYKLIFFPFLSSAVKRPLQSIVPRETSDYKLENMNCPVQQNCFRNWFLPTVVRDEHGVNWEDQKCCIKKSNQ